MMWRILFFFVAGSCLVIALAGIVAFFVSGTINSITGMAVYSNPLPPKQVKTRKSRKDRRIVKREIKNILQSAYLKQPIPFIEQKPVPSNPKGQKTDFSPPESNFSGLPTAGRLPQDHYIPLKSQKTDFSLPIKHFPHSKKD